MSIWCSWDNIGYDDDRTEDRSVLGYRAGYSNYFPECDPGLDLPGFVGIDHAPAWCVPGHSDEYDTDDVAEWLRLSVAEWSAAEQEPMITGSVYMHRSAVEKLRDQLNSWLDRASVAAVTP